MPLSVDLAVSLVIHAPEIRRQSAESPYQADLRAENAIKTEWGACRKCKTVFGFGLHFRKWITGGEAHRDELKL